MGSFTHSVDEVCLVGDILYNFIPVDKTVEGLNLDTRKKFTVDTQHGLFGDWMEGSFAMAILGPEPTDPTEAEA